jgi:hypothetical protein
MGDRSVHYEAAFESLLRERGLPYVSVDEAKRALFANARLKSFDFVVYSKSGPNLLVDVKGRSARGQSGRSSLQTWAGERDVDDLAEWERVFGEGFKAVLMFIYWVDTPLAPGPGLFSFRDRWYQGMGVDLHEYRGRMRRRSAKWKTVALPTADFRSLARPLDTWLS